MIQITKIHLIREQAKPDIINLWLNLPENMPNQLPTFNLKVREGDGERYIVEEMGFSRYELIEVGTHG